MTRPELRTLDNIIKNIERLHGQIDDSVAQGQLLDATRALQNLYNARKRDCEATERA